MFSGCKSHSYGDPDDPTYRTASQIGIFEVLLTTTNRLELCDGSRTDHHRLDNRGLCIALGFCSGSAPRNTGFFQNDDGDLEGEIHTGSPY